MSDNTVNTVVKSGRGPGRPAGRPEDRLTKAKEIFATLSAEGKSRKEILGAIEALPLSKGVATVYYHKAKRAATAVAA